jgi:GxxExxY protein
VAERNRLGKESRDCRVKHEDITSKIIGAAYAIHNKMGGGFLESVYERCMLIELRKAGLLVEHQKPIAVYYDDAMVGEFVADLLVEDTVVVELKAVRELLRIHEVQLVNYLTATNKPVGLLINFGTNRVQVIRKVKDLSDN